MKMRAKDSFYSSETRQVAAGEVFKIDSKSRADEFVKRGLADVVEDDSADATEGDEPVTDQKAAAAPLNKAEPAPLNKAEPKPDNKSVSALKTKGA